MTPEQQLARSRRYHSPSRVELIMLSSTRCALFIPGHSFEFWIGDIAEVPQVLAQRPAPPPPRSNRASLTASLIADL